MTAHKKPRVQLTNVQFFQICEMLKLHRDAVTKQCHTKLDVAVFVKQKLGIDMSPHAVENCLKAVEITLERLNRRGSTNARKSHNTRIIARDLLRLYKKLGEEPSQDLMDLVKRSDLGTTTIQEQPTQPAAPPIPASTIVDPKTISVVNRK